MKRASAGSPADSSPEALRSHVAGLAQQHLDTLRSALELRLSALEAALANPGGGESLERLILDLARVATEEAQAAALRACVDTKLEADNQVAGSRAAAEAALQKERATLSEVRRALEQAQQKTAESERDKQAELRALNAQFEAKLARERSAAGEYQRATAELQQQLEDERASSEDLRRIAGEAKEVLTALGREQAQARASYQQIATELADAQAVAADHERALAEMHARFEAERAARADLQRIADEARRQAEAERAAAADLRRAAEHAERQLSSVQGDSVESVANYQQLATALEDARATAAEFERALAEARDQVDEERAAAAELRAAADQAEQQLSSVQSDKVQWLANYERLESELAAARAEVQSFRGLGAAPGGVDSTSQTGWHEIEVAAEPAARARRTAAEPREQELHHRQPKKAGAPAPNPSEALEPAVIRQGNRYTFREHIVVQVDGTSGTLVDLSVGGCQIVAQTTLKPNHVVKVLLPADRKPIACTGKVMWARLEPAAPGRPLTYRAGVKFTKVDEAAIEAFLSLHNTTT